MNDKTMKAKNKNQIWLPLLILLALAGCDQEPGQRPSGPLSVGDRVPDFEITNILNGTESVDINNSTDELLILDFSGINCAPCMKALPEFEELAKNWEKVKILPVVTSKKEDVQRFFDRKGWTSEIAVNRDEYLKALFPYTIISHIVWIKGGQVMAITKPEEVTKENIQDILDGRAVKLPVKKDQVDYDSDAPLLVDFNGGTSENLIYQSMFSGYLPGLVGKMSRTKNNLVYHNQTPISLFTEAYGTIGSRALMYSNRIKLDMSDSMKEIVENKKLKTSDRFCYNLYSNKELGVETMYGIFKRDVKNFFESYLGIQAEVQKEKKECLILIKNSQNIGQETASERREENEGFYVEGQQMMYFVNGLLNKLKDHPIPLIDETGYTGPVFLALHGDLTNIDTLKKELNKNGMDLVTGQREIDILTLTSPL